MSININNLEIFITLSKKLNFRETSEIHNMDSSTLSRKIARLEERMDTIFFKRDSKKVELTKEGCAFAKYAEKTIQEYKKILAELKDQHQICEGTISIASAPTLAALLLPKVTKSFMVQNPMVSFQTMVTMNSLGSLKKLHQGAYDFLLQSTGGVNDDKTTPISIATSSLVLICPKGSNKVTSLEQLNKQVFLQSEYQDLDILTKGVFEQYNIHPKETHYIQGHEVICNKVAQGLGYALVPKFVYEHHRSFDLIEACNLKESLPPIKIVLRMNESEEKPLHIKAFIEHLQSLSFML